MTRASRRGFGKRKAHEVIKVMADGRSYWSEAEIESLMSMRVRGIQVRKLAVHLGRAESAIHAQISKVDREGIRENVPIKMRPCLRCKTVIGSEGYGIRHCETCRKVLNDLDY